MYIIAGFSLIFPYKILYLIQFNNKIIEKSYPMLEIGYMIRLTNKSLFQKSKDGEVSNRQEALDNFISNAPQGANGIIGIRVSLATQSFKDGNFMYIIYSGTPVKIIEKS
jgi:hypothetical protein